MIYLHAAGFGLVTASILALCAVGLSLQFGVTNYINFAIGSLLTLGAYFAWVANTHGVNIWVAMLIGGVSTAILSVLLNLGIMRHFVKRKYPVFFMLIVMFGLALILQNAVVAIWGGAFQHYDVENQKLLPVGPFLLTAQQMIIMLVTAVLITGVYLLLNYTKTGKAMRAMSDNANLASSCGINTELVTNITWALSGFLAGIAGVVLAVNLVTFQPSFGNDFQFVIFAAVVTGGIGKANGALVGALIIGLVTEVSAAIINPAFKFDMAFLILVLVLLLRPQGIFATERSSVV